MSDYSTTGVTFSTMKLSHRIQCGCSGMEMASRKKETPMPFSLIDWYAPNQATSGEIVVGAIWFAGYCLIILASLSGNFGSMVAAVNVAGLY
jgi:hypothetical protein